MLLATVCVTSARGKTPPIDQLSKQNMSEFSLAQTVASSKDGTSLTLKAKLGFKMQRHIRVSVACF